MQSIQFMAQMVKLEDFNKENILVVGRVGTYCGSLYFVKNKCWITDNTMFAQMKNPINNLFLYQFLNRCNLNDMSTGSGQPLLNQGILKSINVLMPPNTVLEIFPKQANTFERKKYRNQIQVETLTKLRDNLLPELISGRVRVSEGIIIH